MRIGAWLSVTADGGRTNEILEAIAERGVNTVCIMAKDWRGPAHFPSQTAYTSEGFEDPDVLGRAFERAQQLGMEAEAWICTFTEGPRSRLLDEHPECLAESIDSNAVSDEDLNRWPCPAREEVKAYELGICREVLALYPSLNRLHLDYIRYPWSNGQVCACPFCRSQFNDQYGFDLATDVTAPGGITGKGFDAFVRWRCGHIGEVVSRARQIATDAGCELSAAVFPFYPSILFDLGQDWVEWCQGGLLDAVYPMNYNWSANLVGKYTRVHRLFLDGCDTALCEGLLISQGAGVDAARAMAASALEAGSDGLMFFTASALAALPVDTLAPVIGR